MVATTRRCTHWEVDGRPTSLDAALTADVATRRMQLRSERERLAGLVLTQLGLLGVMATTVNGLWLGDGDRGEIAGTAAAGAVAAATAAVGGALLLHQEWLKARAAERYVADGCP
jgi:hypothetical protein